MEQYGTELMHHGVKGMKWGVRRKRINEALNTARSRHQQEIDGYNARVKKAKSNIKTERANIKNARKETFKNRVKINDDFEKEKASIKKETSIMRQSPKVQKAANKAKKILTSEQTKKAVKKGFDLYSKYKYWELTDAIFTGGAGKRMAKETVKQTGRVIISAYMYARGGRDIRWYDN